MYDWNPLTGSFEWTGAFPLEPVAGQTKEEYALSIGRTAEEFQTDLNALLYAPLVITGLTNGYVGIYDPTVIPADQEGRDVMLTALLSQDELWMPGEGESAILGSVLVSVLGWLMKLIGVGNLVGIGFQALKIVGSFLLGHVTLTAFLLALGLLLFGGEEGIKYAMYLRGRLLGYSNGEDVRTQGGARVQLVKLDPDGPNTLKYGGHEYGWKN